jgi:hypothetical protein
MIRTIAQLLFVYTARPENGGFVDIVIPKFKSQSEHRYLMSSVLSYTNLHKCLYSMFANRS